MTTQGAIKDHSTIWADNFFGITLESTQNTRRVRINSESPLNSELGMFHPIAVWRIFLHMGVSKNRGTPKSSHFNRRFHYKPSILGYPYFWKHPYPNKQPDFFPVAWFFKDKWEVCFLGCKSSSQWSKQTLRCWKGVSFIPNSTSSIYQKVALVLWSTICSLKHLRLLLWKFLTSSYS